MNVIAWLRTPIATLIVLCAALLAQLPHAADVFRIIVQADGLLAVAHGYAYAIALELAVLLFVVQRRNIESYLFAVVSVLVNLSYYALHGVDLISIAALPAWLVSIALPAAIARYSHLLVDEPHAAKPGASTDTARRAHQKAPERTQSDAGTSVTTQTETAPHSAPPAGTTAHQTGVAKPPKAKRAPNPNRERARQLRSEDFNTSEIARMLGEKESTVASWLYRDAQKNGVQHND